VIDSVVAGRYRIDRLEGEGATSRVYVATDTRLGRTVALKVLRDELAGDGEFAERFMREARTAASLSHPNIINIFDVGRDGDLTFIVMELVEGRPLREYIDTDAPFDLSDTITILDQLCDAMDYAHGRGVIHRDLKPENVLVTLEGRVKIGDFGLARGVNAATLTAVGTVLGSVRYLSPEQAQGRPASAASDVYSAGILAYEMLTGLPPFDGATPVAVALQHIEAAPLPPTRANPRLPAALDTVLLKALAKDPRQRYQSAMELANAVATATEPAPVVPAAAMPARDPLAATLAMPVIRPGAGVGAVAVPAAATPTIFRAATLPHGSRRNGWTALLVGVMGLAFVILAFMAGAQVLHSLPALPSIVPPSAAGRAALPPTSPGAVSVAAASTPTATPTASPTVTRTATPTVSGSVTVTPTASDTPETTPTPFATDIPLSPSPTPPPTWTPAPPPPTATPAPPPGMVAVPNVVGMIEQDGQQAIKNAGLATTFPNYQSGYTSQPAGHILSQQPAPGAIVAKGTTVYIAVRR